MPCQNVFFLNVGTPIVDFFTLFSLSSMDFNRVRVGFFGTSQYGDQVILQPGRQVLAEIERILSVVEPVPHSNAAARRWAREVLRLESDMAPSAASKAFRHQQGGNAIGVFSVFFSDFGFWRILGGSSQLVSG